MVVNLKTLNSFAYICATLPQSCHLMFPESNRWWSNGCVLVQVVLLSTLDKYQRTKIADCLVEETFHRGDLIIKQVRLLMFVLVLECECL